MYQSITIVGYLGTDPELRHTPSGVPVASFSVATNRSWTDANGQKQDKTTWFRVSAWQKQAEIVTQYLKKGSKVLVVGEIEDARAFTDKDGNMRASLELRSQSVRFLDSKSDNAGGGNYTPQSTQAPAQTPPHGAPAPEDIPF